MYEQKNRRNDRASRYESRSKCLRKAICLSRIRLALKLKGSLQIGAGLHFASGRWDRSGGLVWPVAGNDISMEAVRFKLVAKALDVICATNKESRPAIQVQQLIQPVAFSNRMRSSDLLLKPVGVPIVAEGLISNILLLPDTERLPLFVVGIAISMSDALSVCDLLAERLGGVLLRESLIAHFLGYRSHFIRLAALFEEIPKLLFRGVSRPLIFVACADKHDGLHSGQPIPAYGRRGGGVRPDHPTPSGHPPVTQGPS